MTDRDTPLVPPPDPCFAALLRWLWMPDAIVIDADGYVVWPAWVQAVCP